MQGVITAEKLAALYAAFNTAFRNGLQRGRIVPGGADASMAKYLLKFSECGMNIPSTTLEELHTWITAIPGFVEWVGDRVAQSLDIEGLRAVNKDYQQTVEIDRNRILDDQYGAYATVIENMGAEGSDDAFWLDLLIAALISSDLWADGAAFFSNSRAFGDNTIDNAIDASISQANIKSAASLMLGYKNAKNNPLNVVPYMVAAGVTAFWTAKKFLENETVTDDAGTVVTNETRGIALPRWHPGLGANDWYMFGMKGSYMPLVAQRRQEAGALIAKTDPASENVFWQKKYCYGTDLRGTAIRPFPFLIVRGYSASGPVAGKPAGKAAADTTSVPPKK